MLLTQQDRQDVEAAIAQARIAGYDRLAIEAIVPPCGAPGADAVLAYRAGEAWSSWVLIRDGDVVRAWSNLTGKDAGVFPTMSEALGSVLVWSSGRA